jgi:hypothetical protein
MYRVRDYFLRIEFQHRGSPHAHILLWLENSTTLEGLYLINEKEDFKFHHGYCCNTPTIQCLKTEYKRLEQHRLRTLTSRVETFLQYSDVFGSGTKMIIANINVQSRDRFRTAEMRLLCVQRDVDERRVGRTDQRLRVCRETQQSIPRRTNCGRRSCIPQFAERQYV